MIHFYWLLIPYWQYQPRTWSLWRDASIYNGIERVLLQNGEQNNRRKNRQMLSPPCIERNESLVEISNLWRIGVSPMRFHRSGSARLFLQFRYAIARQVVYIRKLSPSIRRDERISRRRDRFLLEPTLDVWRSVFVELSTTNHVRWWGHARNAIVQKLVWFLLKLEARFSWTRDGQVAL